MDNRNLLHVKHKFDNTRSYIGGNSTIIARQCFAKRLTQDINTQSILDLGCGDGSIGVSVSDSKSHLVLMDLSEKMLEVASENAKKKRISNFEIKKGDVTEFRYGSTFDLVICLGVLAHVPSIKECIQTISVHLSSGDKAMVQFTEKNSLQGRVAYKWFSKASASYCVNETSMEILNPIFEKVGLKIIDELRYSESSLGTNILGVKVSTPFKVLSSKLGLLSRLFSGSIVLLEKQ
ncbi:class I SAM-dependent methyltransferase [Akkermansiaceae bacterium]|nr:class I SAM-dependent methyltransferase [Akkermansiaceae bacterium]